MSAPSRRHLLAGAAGLVTLTAGCLDGGGLATSPGPADDDENATHDDDSGDDDGGDDATEDDDPLESTTVAFQHGNRPETPTVDLLITEDQANRWASDRSIAADTVSEFIDETDFEKSGVIALEAGANTPCYEMVVGSVDLEDETVTVHAEVTEANEGDGLCAQQVVAVGALVRASVDGDAPSSISVTIVDADGSKYVRGVSVASDSNVSSEPDETNRSGSETGTGAAGSRSESTSDSGESFESDAGSNRSDATDADSD